MKLFKAILKQILGRGSMRSYSQFGEDAVLNSMLRKQAKGFYVDVGAYHPMLYSNTYALYTRGWNGIAVDPNIKMEGLYKFFRPRDIFVGSGVSKNKSSLKYYEYADAAYNSFSEAQVNELKDKNKISPLRESSVPVKPLREIVAAHHVTSIDLLSVDVEGMDLEVLESHDWSIRPRLVLMEAHGFNPENPQAYPTYVFMKDKGYKLRSIAGLSLIFEDMQAVDTK
ncbi:MAG: hypothetical protein JWN64_4 [Parcubacteria group bacterium]|nr:hypothetical protein [Parcubacteria group bacterium]